MSGAPIPAESGHVAPPGSTGATSAPSQLLVVDAEKALGGSSNTSVMTGGDPALEKGAPVTPPDAPVGADAAPRKVHGVAWALVVVSILSSTFLFALDNTVVADVQPYIIARFGSITKLPWLSVAFLLGALSTNLIWGKLHEQFNVKYLYLFNIFLFEVGSALCGAANTMDALIIGRTIAGIGGIGLYVGVMTLLSVTTTTHERPMYIGLTGLTWGLGTVLGPVVGGAFADSSATWRWAFYINLVIGAVFAPIYIFLIPSIDPRPSVSIKARIREIDYFGGTVIVGAFISGIMAINFGGSVYEWNSGRIIGLFVCSGVLFIILGFQQVFGFLTNKERRIFPVEFLRRRSMVVLFALTSAAVTATFVPIYFIPLYFQFVAGDSALDAGVRLLPFVVLLVVTVVLNGVILSKQGFYMPWYLVGGILTLIGGALMYTVERETSTARVYGYSILIAVGSGAFIQASFSVAQAKVQPKDIPLAVGFITCGQVGGGTIALAISNSVFLNRSTNELVRIIPDSTAASVRGAIAGRGSALFERLTADQREAVLNALVDSIGRVYILVITAGALAIVLSAFLKREKLFLEAGGAG